MNRLQLLFYPKEVQHLLLELDLLWTKYDSGDFVSSTSCVPILKPQIDSAIKKNKADIAKVLRNGTKPSIMALNMIANLAGDWLETGKYHLHRGVLNPLAGGESLLRVFNGSVNRLVELGEISKVDAERNKNQLLKHIRSNG